MSDIELRIKEIIAKNLSVDISRVTPDASFVQDLGADSLDLVEVIMALEEEFGAEIPDEEAEKLKTVAEAITYIQEYLKNNPKKAKAAS